MDKICGIYKITSPSNKVYIGSSRNIHKRWLAYKNCSKSQHKLFDSINNYGIEIHQFEVILECELKDLFYFERCFQEIYNSIEYGLNCVYVNTDEKPLVISEEVRKKMSNSQLGKKHSLVTIEKRKNYKHSKEIIQKIIDKQSKTIIQYSLEGVYIKEWKSASEASVYLNKHPAHISSCCLGKRKTAYGYKWKFKHDK